MIDTASAGGEDRGEPRPLVLCASEQGGVEVRALVEPVDVGLPGEADAAMGLDGAGGDIARARGEGRDAEIAQSIREPAA